ncbi:hypothetical protein AgCh_000767 [Apium graveolens]
MNSLDRQQKFEKSPVQEVEEALLHVSVACHRKLIIDWIPVSDLEETTAQEVNPDMVPQLEKAGLSFPRKDETGQRMENDGVLKACAEPPKTAQMDNEGLQSKKESFSSTHQNMV